MKKTLRNFFIPIGKPVDTGHLQYRNYVITGFIAFSLFFCLGIKEGATKSQHSLETDKAYNVVMIWIDALRADHLSCYGYDRNTSPSIDLLAQDSAVFENNFSPNTVTISSFMSIITSLYPDSHGVFHVAKDNLSPHIKTLASILKMYGYSNIWFGPKGDPHLDPGIGFGRGFDMVRYFPDNFDEARMVLFEAIEKNKDAKFFLNFHTYRVHAPYMPSPKYKNVFTFQKKQGIVETFEALEAATFYLMKDGLSDKNSMVSHVFGKDLSQELISHDLFTGEFSTRRMYEIGKFLKNKKQEYKLDHLRLQAYLYKIDACDIGQMDHIKSLYDATILEFDTEIIGPLISTLKKRNLYEKTIIVLCSDHGDEFGEHGKLGHGETLYDEVIHVPLILKLPWSHEVKRIKTLIQTVDIMPTLLDLLGIPIPHYSQGKSLLPFIKRNQTKPLREFVFGHILDDTLSIRSTEWKLILGNNMKKELYHIPSDPAEKQNLYTVMPEIASRLEKRLMDWRASLASYKVESSFLPHIDEATKERIKKTGYW